MPLFEWLKALKAHKLPVFAARNAALSIGISHRAACPAQLTRAARWRNPKSARGAPPGAAAGAERLKCVMSDAAWRPLEPDPVQTGVGRVSDRHNPSHRHCAAGLSPMRVEVIGAGVAGLTAAFELARLGASAGYSDRPRRAPAPSWNGLFAFRGRHDRALVRAGKRRTHRRHARRGGAGVLDQRHPGCDASRAVSSSRPARERAELIDFSRRTENFEKLDARRRRSVWSPTSPIVSTARSILRRRRISIPRRRWRRWSTGLRSCPM